MHYMMIVFLLSEHEINLFGMDKIFFYLSLFLEPTKMSKNFLT